MKFLLLLLCFLPGVVRAAEPAAPVGAVRVVSQFVGGDELLLAVAEPGQIAALSHIAREAQYSAVAGEAAAFPQIAKGDAETILKFAPTLVLFADYSRTELIESVRRTGVKVLVFDRYRTLDDAYACLRLLARELGPAAEARAGAVIAGCQQRMAALQTKLAGVKPVRVIAPSTYGVIGGAGTTFQDLCDFAGAENLAVTVGGLQGHAPPPNEQMLTWPIERVVVAGDTLAAALEPYQQLVPYRYLAVIRERRAALLEPYMLSCVTHHRVAAYERLARELHPALFQ